jgi:hypothetical protein
MSNAAQSFLCPVIQIPTTKSSFNLYKYEVFLNNSKYFPVHFCIDEVIGYNPSIICLQW